jgi:hypothetical protein
MKKKIVVLLSGVLFAALMVLNFNHARTETNASTVSVDLLGAAQAQSESCPCYYVNCTCIYKVVDCPNGGSGCKTSGNQCSSYRDC